MKNLTHDYSGADFGFPKGDARVDLTDLFAFPKPLGSYSVSWSVEDDDGEGAFSMLSSSSLNNPSLYSFRSSVLPQFSVAWNMLCFLDD